jgi:hypothetical protein
MVQVNLTQPGIVVTMRRNIPLWAYEKPATTSAAFASHKDVAAGVKEHAMVERAEGSAQVWLKIRAKGDISYAGEWAYILVNTADLEPK